MARTWSESDIPHLTGTTVVVTAANSGLGLEVARGLASRGAHLVLAVRSTDRGLVRMESSIPGLVAITPE